MDLNRYIPRPQAAKVDPWAARPAVPSAAPQPPAAPAAALGTTRRVGLVSWIAGHTLKFAWRLATAALILDSPRRVSSTDPTENAKMRHASAILWGVVLPVIALVTGGFLAAAGLGIFGWFVLVRNQAATQAITVTPASLIDDLIIVVRRSREARTAALVTAALIVAGGLTSIFALAVGQAVLVTAWLGALGLARAATTAGIEDLEQIDLSSTVSRATLRLAAAANRAVEKLRGKAGTDVEKI